MAINRPFSWMGSQPDGYDNDEPEWGTNTGRQGIFDPRNPRHTNQAVARLRELQQQWGDRLAMNFTGDTGLAKNDADGYSKMLNARTEAANISNILSGKQPLRVNYGGTFPAVGALDRLKKRFYSPEPMF